METTLTGKRPCQGSFYDLFVDGITQGLLANLLSCPEKARLKYCEGLSINGTTVPLQFGSLFHHALEVTYQEYNGEVGVDVCCLTAKSRQVIGQDYNEVSTALSQQLTSESLWETLNETFRQVDVVMEGYWNYHKDDFNGTKWVGLEQEFQVLAPVNYRGKKRFIPVRGKIDGIYKSFDEMWMFETKTKARIEDAAADKLTFEMQVMVYAWAIEQMYGEQIAGVTYNLVRRPQLRRKKDEMLPEFIERIREDIAARPDFYYARQEVPLHESHFARFRSEFTSMLENVIRWWEGELDFRNSAACNGSYGTCEFMPVCSRKKLEAFSKRDVVFPELSEE